MCRLVESFSEVHPTKVHHLAIYVILLASSIKQVTRGSPRISLHQYDISLTDS